MRSPIRSACVALLLSGCLPTGVAAPAEEFSKNVALWELREPTAYEFIFQRSCECLPEQTILVKVKVIEGQIESVSSVPSGEAVAPESHRTLSIDEVFAEIGDALEGAAHRINVTYDPMYGYPTSVFIDYNQQVVDDEVQIMTKDLRPVD